MFWMSYFYLRWVRFWQLPETVHTQRVQTPQHVKKVDLLRYVWLVAVLILAAVGHLALLVFGLVFLTFVSFMFLDEVK